MTEFIQNEWCQCDIINKTKIITKQGSDKIHGIIPKKYQNYTSNTILKHDNVLAKVDQLPWGRLLNTPSHDAYSITIHMCTMTLADISYKQNE